VVCQQKNDGLKRDWFFEQPGPIQKEEEMQGELKLDVGRILGWDLAACYLSTIFLYSLGKPFICMAGLSVKTRETNCL